MFGMILDGLELCLYFHTRPRVGFDALIQGPGYHTYISNIIIRESTCNNLISVNYIHIISFSPSQQDLSNIIF